MLPCRCNGFVNSNGFGACQKRDENFNGGFSCFVDQPSTCKDLKNSTTDPVKQLSASACEDKNEGKVDVFLFN